MSLHDREKQQQQQQQDPDNNCTIVWEADGNVQFSTRAEFVVRLDVNINPKKLGGSSSFRGNSERTSVTVDSRSVPLEAVHATAPVV